MLRIDEQFDRGPPVTIRVDGEPVRAYLGESVAAALLSAGLLWLRCSPSAGTPRGAFCMMGVCQDCLAVIDERRQRSCMCAVRDGLEVELLK